MRSGMSARRIRVTPENLPELLVPLGDGRIAGPCVFTRGGAWHFGWRTGDGPYGVETLCGRTLEKGQQFHRRRIATCKQCQRRAAATFEQSLF